MVDDARQHSAIAAGPLSYDLMPGYALDSTGYAVAGESGVVHVLVIVAADAAVGTISDKKMCFIWITIVLLGGTPRRTGLVLSRPQCK